MPPQEGLRAVVVANADLAVGASGDDSESVIVLHHNRPSRFLISRGDSSFRVGILHFAWEFARPIASRVDSRTGATAGLSSSASSIGLSALLDKPAVAHSCRTINTGRNKFLVPANPISARGTRRAKAFCPRPHSGAIRKNRHRSRDSQGRCHAALRPLETRQPLGPRPGIFGTSRKTGAAGFRVPRGQFRPPRGFSTSSGNLLTGRGPQLKMASVSRHRDSH